jgi:hypothetical protein
VNKQDPQLQDLVVLFVGIKIAFVIVALFSHYLLPFDVSDYSTNLVLDIQDLPAFFRRFNTWDTQHYLLLSERGYGVNPMSNAFYPLYPYLIWVFTPLFLGHGLIAAYIVANVCSLLVPVYMYKLCCLFWTKEQAFRSTILLLAFPTAFFLSVAYTEALYLSLCLMAFYYLFKKDTAKSCVCCFLLPLTRAQALLFIVPILVMLVEEMRQKKAGPAEASAVDLKPFLLPACATLAGVVVYFVFCWWKLSDFAAGLQAQRLYVGDNALSNLLHPMEWMSRNFLDVNFTLHGYTTSLIDRAAFLICAPLLIGVYRTEDRALFAYAALTLLVPALAGSFMSYLRVLLVVFPLFIYLGIRIRRAEYLAVPMFVLQVFFYVMHTGAFWVA